MQNPNCQGSHCTKQIGEVRLLPAGGDSNMILCRDCFDYEIVYRNERNRQLANSCQFRIPTWQSLEVYTGV